MISTFVESYALLSIDVNKAETKLLVIRYDAPTQPISPVISIADEPIEKVEQFSYLGSIVSSFGDPDAEINPEFEMLQQ